jgi:putative restriction endonuclease
MRKNDDASIRLAVFDWLSQNVSEKGDVLPRSLLTQGFIYKGQRIPLMGPQGIFKPKVLNNIPISITTSPNSPYSDSFGPDGLLLYKYRGTNPQHHENVGLRRAMIHQAPLVYFHGIVPGKYMAVFPVFIVGDQINKLSFKVAADDSLYIENALFDNTTKDNDTVSRRVYITSSVLRRLHQRGFRERVLDAYKNQCALCRLKHRELLDAAHIIPDSQPEGEPVVNNGIARCKLHHAAFDKFFLGIRFDYIIHVRKDILKEKDGPMLRHGLQGLHNQKLLLPQKKDLYPSTILLERRWEQFKNSTRCKL